MKIKTKIPKSNATILSKFNMFGGRMMEHQAIDDGYKRKAQLYPQQVIEKKTNILPLLQLHLNKKFQEKKNAFYTYNKLKNTKQIKQLIQIQYFNKLAKKIYFLVLTLKRIIKAIKIWIKQMIQTEIYYMRQAINIAKTKAQLNLIYFKMKMIKAKYKSLYIRYIGYISKRYVRYVKRQKKIWSRMLVHGFAKRLKQRNKIIPLIFFLRKNLLKKLRTGTLKRMRYWTKLIKAFCSKYKLLGRHDVRNIIRNPITEDKSNTVEYITTKTNIIKPLVLLKYISLLNNPSRKEIIRKIKRNYYNLLLNIKVKNKQKRIKKKRKNTYSKVARFYALVANKKRNMLRHSYLKRRIMVALARFNYISNVRVNSNSFKEAHIAKAIAKKRLSPWFILQQKFRMIKLFKFIKNMGKNKRKKTYNNRRFNTKRITLNKNIKKVIKKINKKQIKLNIKEYSYKKRIKNLKKRRIKQKKYKKRFKRRNKKMTKRIWRRKMTRITRRTPYMYTCRLYRDYSADWIDSYKNKSAYNQSEKNKIPYELSNKLKNRKLKRRTKRNYKKMSNSIFNIIIKQKEVLNSAVRMFNIN